MTHYYAQIDGQRRAFAMTQTAESLDRPELIELQSFDESVLGKVHNAATGQWDQASAVPEPRRVAVLAFRRRFTSAERAAIEWAAVDRSDQPVAIRQQAAALRSILADQAAAKFIDLEDADTVAGAQGLEAMGLLAAGRAGEIITAPVLPEELP